MKKYLYLLAALTLTACTGEKKAESQAAENEEEKENVVITDALCMDAKGPVAEIEISTKSGLFNSIFTYKFDENGELISIEDGQRIEFGKDDIKMERDAEKRPVKMTTGYFDEMDDEEPSESVVIFTYDANNTLVKEEHSDGGDTWTMDYELGEDGKVVAFTVSSVQDNQKYTVTYPEDAVDSYGNWISRSVTSNGDTATVTRKITYRN